MTLDLSSRVTEREWQRTVVEAAKLYGWRVKCDRNVRVQRKDGSCYFTTAIGGDGVGFPDLILLRERMIVAELKVGHNKPTPEQSEWLDCFRRIPGVEVYVWYPGDWDKVEITLREA